VGQVKLVVTDMDGTLYSWVDYIVPAVEALVESVCRATGYPRLKVVQALKEVYARYESNEYPFALQESSLYRDFPEFGSFDRLVIEPARAAFSAARRRYLQPFPHVRETLHALQERGVPVVALTDAPRNPAEARVRRLGLEPLLKGLYTLPAFHFPKGPEGEVLVSPAIRAREARGEYRASVPVVELPRDWEKPDPRGLLRICADVGVAPDEVLVVGDSLRKDVAVARQVGALDAWAEYGTYVSLEYRERLDVISAPAITRRHAHALLEGEGAGVREGSAPAHALSNFGGVLQLLGD
jgi:FMN phosphatase YigB (HAD superfamily)